MKVKVNIRNHLVNNAAHVDILLAHASIDEQNVDAVLEQPLTQERVLGALRVERAEEDDCLHERSASGSTPRKRRCSSGS